METHPFAHRQSLFGAYTIYLLSKGNQHQSTCLPGDELSDLRLAFPALLCCMILSCPPEAC